jgi:predicted AlkP superfamily phosphohydrolase/phosphomutase
VEKNLNRDKQWFIILQHLMKNDPADLTAIVFDGVDKLLHPYWRLLDPNCRPHKLLDAEQRLRDCLLNYFQQLDAYMREIVTLAGDEAHVILASDHGFGPAHYVFHINVLLEQLGYLSWRKEVRHAKVKKHNHEWSFASLDWSKTTAYVGTPSSNGVRIRLPANTAPHNYLAFRERLMEQLLNFKDPTTGEQIVTRVSPREEAFPGPAMEQAPDLTLTLSDHSFVSVINEKPIVLHRPEINGTHRPEGILIIGGPGVIAGENPEPYSILDIAPTILSCLGLPIPPELEGKVMVEAFAEHYPQTCMMIGEAKTEGPADLPRIKSPFSEDEEEAIWAQLRALGYVE